MAAGHPPRRRGAALVLCDSGAGGGSQQAMFRSHLEPLLARAHRRWLEGFEPAAPAAARLDRLFGAIQREFEALREPASAPGGTQARPRARWHLHSRLALAVVGLGTAA